MINAKALSKILAMIFLPISIVAYLTIDSFLGVEIFSLAKEHKLMEATVVALILLIILPMTFLFAPYLKNSKK